MRNLERLYSGDDPDWAAFVGDYGTHYVHALTYGWHTLAETKYSLEAETTAWQNSVDISLNAQGTVDAFTLGGKVDTGFEWGGKLGSKVSSNDVLEVSVGSDKQPAAILFDLRPLWELFSPVFFEPNLSKFTDATHAAAPFVWRDLRASYRAYLQKTVGLNQPLDDSFYRDDTPYIVEVQPSLKFSTSGREVSGMVYAKFDTEAGVATLTPLPTTPYCTMQNFAADGSVSGGPEFKPYTTFAAISRSGKGKAGVLSIGIQQFSDDNLESEWTFPFSLDGSEGSRPAGLGQDPWQPRARSKVRHQCAPQATSLMSRRAVSHPS